MTKNDNTDDKLPHLTSQWSKHHTTLLFPHQVTVFHFRAFKQDMLRGLHAGFLNKSQKPSVYLANLQAQKKLVTKQTHTHTLKWLNSKHRCNNFSVYWQIMPIPLVTNVHTPTCICFLQSRMQVWMLLNPSLSTRKFILLPNATTMDISTLLIFTNCLVHTKE